MTPRMPLAVLTSRQLQVAYSLIISCFVLGSGLRPPGTADKPTKSETVISVSSLPQAATPGSCAQWLPRNFNGYHVIKPWGRACVFSWTSSGGGERACRPPAENCIFYVSQKMGSLEQVSGLCATTMPSMVGQ